MKKSAELKQQKENLQNEIRSLLDDNKVDAAEEKMVELRSVKMNIGLEEEIEAEERSIVDKQTDKQQTEKREGDLMGDIALRSIDKLRDRENFTKEERSLDIGKYIRGVVTGNWKGAEAEQRALTTTVSGVVIPQVLSTEIIDLARNVSLFTHAGVPVIPMTTNNMTIARVKNDPSFKFKEEGGKAEESTFELESVDLKTKTAYGYAYVSLEAIESAVNLTEIINDTFSRAMAECIDQAMLYGQYNGSSYDKFAPSGIMNDTDINSITAKEGDGWDSIIKGISKVRKANGRPNTFGINADTEEMLTLIKDSTGQYLSPPIVLQGLTPITSNQLKHDDTDGDDAIVFDNNAMVIGLLKAINIQMFDAGDKNIENGMIAFRIYAMLDCQVTQPKHICKITGIK